MLRHFTVTLSSKLRLGEIKPLLPRSGLGRFIFAADCAGRQGVDSVLMVSLRSVEMR